MVDRLAYGDQVLPDGRGGEPRVDKLLEPGLYVGVTECVERHRAEQAEPCTGLGALVSIRRAFKCSAGCATANPQLKRAANQNR